MIAWVKVQPYDPRAPGRGVILRPAEVHATILRLRACQAARATGHVAMTTDPAWLVDMAINRRAGWPDDPSHARGSALPVNGKYPRRAEGDTFMLCWHMARRLADRILTRETDARCLPRKVRERIAHRLYGPDDF